jgi:hypothetical protein
VDRAAGGRIGRRAARPVLPAAPGPLLHTGRRHHPARRAGRVHRHGRGPGLADHPVPFPALRAIEALATSVALFLLLFASTYVVLATMSATNFGGHLSHTDGLYFIVTVFSTVGFGDITAKTETARLVVTGQMIADLIYFGLAIKVITGAVRRGRQGPTSRPPAGLPLLGGCPPASHPRCSECRTDLAGLHAVGGSQEG